MAPLLKGQVIAIITDSAVVLNIGKINQVTKGMKFVIYEEGEMLKDLEGRDLERFEIVKGEVEVTHVQDKVSTAESFTREKRVYNPLDYNPYAPREIIQTEVVPLRAKPTMKVQFSPVKVGDLVRQQP